VLQVGTDISFNVIIEAVHRQEALMHQSIKISLFPSWRLPLENYILVAILVYNNAEEKNKGKRRAEIQAVASLAVG
jgi:hypothetical protein